MGSLEKWLLANAEDLKLKIRVFGNEALESLGIFDIEAEIEANGTKYFGRGTDFSKDIALLKSCSEAIERFFLRKYKFTTSNGMAVHSDKNLAVESAKMELIERDLFLTRYLTQSPYTEIMPECAVIERAQKYFSNKENKLRFFSMGKINSIPGFLCSIDGLGLESPYGYILGTSAGASEKATEASFLEAFRNFAHYKSGEAITVSQFRIKQSLTKVDFRDHGNLALDVEYATNFRNRFLSDRESLDLNEVLEINFQIDFLSTVDTPFESAPISVVRASSPDLQGLFAGYPTEKSINLHRLNNFCHLRKQAFNLNDVPHPFN